MKKKNGTPISRKSHQRRNFLGKYLSILLLETTENYSFTITTENHEKLYGTILHFTIGNHEKVSPIVSFPQVQAPTSTKNQTERL